MQIFFKTLPMGDFKAFLQCSTGKGFSKVLLLKQTLLSPAWAGVTLSLDFVKKSPLKCRPSEGVIRVYHNFFVLKIK
ncbi:MAG: hypothetical protein KatS3mg091_278 [Patescibacteria group bacterium]|nr:MAG: hypothetical protein KatS3mg091_278 [Patescibacteria group bacterium]